MRKLGITLMTKGTASVFHRKPFVDMLRQGGYDITFVCAQGAQPSLRKMAGCNYVDYDLRLKHSWWCAGLLSVSRYVRMLYPASIQEHSRRNAVISLVPFSAKKMLGFLVGSFVARSKWLVFLLMKLEQWIVRDKICPVDPESWLYDVLIVGGIGQKNSRDDGYVTIYARSNGIRVVNVVANYDALTAKGFRGCDVDDVVVWGAAMEKDLVRLHGVDSSHVHRLGSPRYQYAQAPMSRQAFFESKGLPHGSKIVYYCASVFPVHTLEVLRAYDELLPHNPNIRLVIRLYPSKPFLDSTFCHYLSSLVDQRDGVSFDHPMQAASATRDGEFLEVLDYDYWHYLRHADVVINYYSSVSIDALVFSKDCVCLNYYPETIPFMSSDIARNLERIYIHHERSKMHGVIRYADSLEALKRLISERLGVPCDPETLASLIKDERGPIDEDYSKKFLSLLSGGVCLKGEGLNG